MTDERDDAVQALVVAIDAIFEGDLERADDATKQGLSKIRQQKGGTQ